MRTWTKEEIINLIETNDKMVGRSLLMLYAEQTAEEQALHETAEQNGRGFNGVDANILSSFAEFYKRTNYLSPKQLEIARKKLKKYAKQLTAIANEKAKAKAQEG